MSYTIMAGTMGTHTIDGEERPCLSFIDKPLANRLSMNMTSGNLAAVLGMVGVKAFNGDHAVNELEGDALQEAYVKACQSRGINTANGEIVEYDIYYGDSLNEYMQTRMDQLISLFAYAIEKEGLIYWA